MSLTSKSLMKVPKLDYQFYYQEDIIRLSLDNNSTIGDALDMLAQQLNVPSSELQLYIAKKSGEPKLSYPPFERERLLTKTLELTFSVVRNSYQNSLALPPQPIEIPLEKRKQSRILRWLGCQ